MTGQRQIESGYADVNGARLYYEIAGEGHPLVLIHAGVADLRMWDAQIEEFAERFRVVRYDMRGFGRSTSPAGEFAHYDDLYGLLRHLDIDRAHLIGVSMGGSACIDLALLHPEMMTALIPVCAGVSGFRYEGEMPPGWDQILAEDEELERLIKQGDKQRAAELGADLDVRLWAVGLYRAPEQVDAGFRARARELARGTYGHVDVEMKMRPLEPPALERLGDIGAPTLVVVGDCDLPSARAAADLMEQRIPRARKVTIADTAHLPPMERPAQFNQIVLDFLGST